MFTITSRCNLSWLSYASAYPGTLYLRRCLRRRDVCEILCLTKFYPSYELGLSFSLFLSFLRIHGWYGRNVLREHRREEAEEMERQVERSAVRFSIHFYSHFDVRWSQRKKKNLNDDTERYIKETRVISRARVIFLKIWKIVSTQRGGYPLFNRKIPLSFSIIRFHNSNRQQMYIDTYKWINPDGYICTAIPRGQQLLRCSLDAI